jgi:hypothetical protein
MKEELVKQLKNAGFPLHWYDNDNGPGSWEDPTLSEPIEACGNGLQSLINNFYNEEKGWIAFTNRKDESGERMDIWGESPEEAVARLWLVLKAPAIPEVELEQ